ncbi:protein FAR1-related sequence 6 [Tanacetum coccineum]
MYCGDDSQRKLKDHTEDTISIYHVTNIVERKHGLKKRVVYNVSYDVVGCDIKCSCHLFEFRGIVCRHMVKILIENDVKELPSCYILSRWRKDVKHRYNFVKNCYDDLKSEEQAKQFDHLCAKFYEAANILDSLEKYEYLMKCLDEAKEKLIDPSSWGVNHVSNSNEEELLIPWQVRGRGRPPK